MEIVIAWPRVHFGISCWGAELQKRATEIVTSFRLFTFLQYRWKFIWSIACEWHSYSPVYVTAHHRHQQQQQLFYYYLKTYLSFTARFPELSSLYCTAEIRFLPLEIRVAAEDNNEKNDKNGFDTQTQGEKRTREFPCFYSSQLLHKMECTAKTFLPQLKLARINFTFNMT